MGDEGWSSYNTLRDDEAATAAAHTLARGALTRTWMRNGGASLTLIPLMAVAGLYVTEEGPVYWILLAGTLVVIPSITIALTMNRNPIAPALGTVIPGAFIGVVAAALQFRSIDGDGFGLGFLLMAWLAGSVLALILASMRAFQRRRSR